MVFVVLVFFGSCGWQMHISNKIENKCHKDGGSVGEHNNSFICIKRDEVLWHATGYEDWLDK